MKIGYVVVESPTFLVSQAVSFSLSSSLNGGFTLMLTTLFQSGYNNLYISFNK